MIIEDCYRIVVDPKQVNRWYLGALVDSEGNELDSRDFTQGGAIEVSEPCCVSVRRRGLPLEFNFADFDMLVVSQRLSQILAEYAGVALQLISASIDGWQGEKFYIANVCDLVECIDEQNSQFLRWSDIDGRPDKVGQYRMISELKINRLLASGHNLFRVAGWSIALIASGELKRALEKSGVSGISFVQVS